MLLALACGACGGRAREVESATRAEAPPDVRTAPGRPPVVLVSREGDPATAIAFAITTAGIEEGDPEPATALAGLVESRLHARSIDARVLPGWDGLRAAVLATSEADAVRVTEALRDALLAPATEADVASAKRKLGALAQRPLKDRALDRWARCVGDPFSSTERAGKPVDVDPARLERWRSAAFGLGRVAVAVAGSAKVGEAVARTVLRGTAWKTGAIIPAPTDPGEAAFTYELGSEPVVHLTIDVGTGSAAVNTAEALGNPQAPLAARLSELDLPFRIREVAGAAHVLGGCVGVVLEATSTASDLPAKVADAVALVHLEASAHLADTEHAPDGRVLSRRSGDAREAAERAAWWALVDTRDAPRPAGRGTSGRAGSSSVALAIPSRRGTPSAPVSREALATAVTQARAAWEKPVVELRARTEPGQGETWVLLASPCGTDAETDADAGLSALVAAATADVRVPEGVHVEPWISADGIGLLVHGAPHEGEAPSAHARRLADVAARSFAAEPLDHVALTRGRADLLRRSNAALAVVADAVAPQHPSWIIPSGSSEPIARTSDGAVLLRAQALRAGPLRLAVIANTDATQTEAAVRAADRWVPRRLGEARTCRAPAAAAPARPGTYALALRPGAVPEAYLAFPLPAGDDAARRLASFILAMLDGEGAWLERALASIAFESSARVVGTPRAPALVIRIAASQASLDAAVMQTRGLLDRLRSGAIVQGDVDRAAAARARAALAVALDPRARVVATWRGEPVDPARPAPSLEDVRTFAQRYLGEESMVVVAARPPRYPVAP